MFLHPFQFHCALRTQPDDVETLPEQMLKLLVHEIARYIAFSRVRILDQSSSISRSRILLSPTYDTLHGARWIPQLVQDVSVHLAPIIL